MAKEFAKKFYSSKAWKDCRKSYIDKRIMIDGGLCERCNQIPGYILHHKVELNPMNITNPDITLNHCNLEYVCKACHDAEHSAEFSRGHLMCMLDEHGRVIPDPNR